MLATKQQYDFSLELLQGLEVICHHNDLFCHLPFPKGQSLSAQLQLAISNCAPPLRWAIECCMERGASSWLSVFPLEQCGFALHKGEFIDVVCFLCYGFMPVMLP